MSVRLLLLVAVNVSLIIARAHAAPPVLGPAQGVTLHPGGAVRLALPPVEAGAVCVSRDAKVAQAFNNGWCFGIVLGTTEVEVRRAAGGETVGVFRVRVVEEKPRVLTAGDIQQHPDNRRFRTVDGRQCYGSELNARQAESKGTKSNRVVNPKRPGGDVLWPVEKGARIVDGAGTLIGTVAPQTAGGERLSLSKFNHGMTKVLNGEVHVYSFATPVRLATPRDGRSEVGVSAWMPLREVIDKETLLDLLHPGTGKVPAVELSGETFRITGGNPKEFATEDGTPLKIVKNVNTPPKAIDYLVRDAGTINVLYCVPGFALGGHGLDSFLVSSGAQFRPGKDIRKITVPTYFPPGHAKAGEVTPKPMTFVYGAVEVKGAPPVFGWVAEAALSGVVPEV